MGTLLFSFVATNLAGFSVPVEVGACLRVSHAPASPRLQSPSPSVLRQ